MSVPSELIPLPWTNPPLSGNRTRGNPYAQGAKVSQALQEARVAVRTSTRGYWTVPVVVTLHFRPKDQRRRDADNLAMTLKVCQDALVQEDVLQDDSWKYVRRAAQEIHEPDGRKAAMWLEITEWRPA